MFSVRYELNVIYTIQTIVFIDAILCKNLICVYIYVYIYIHIYMYIYIYIYKMKFNIKILDR